MAVAPLIASPGADSAQLATFTFPKTQMLIAPTVQPVTPPPPPLPATGGSWLEQQLRVVSDAIATGRSSFEQSKAETHATIRQIASLDIAGSVQSTLDDVHSAGQLKQMLPFVVAALGIVLGRPAIGIGAGVLVWLAGQKRA